MAGEILRRGRLETPSGGGSDRTCWSGSDEMEVREEELRTSGFLAQVSFSTVPVLGVWAGWKIGLDPQRLCDLGWFPAQTGKVGGKTESKDTPRQKLQKRRECSGLEQKLLGGRGGPR